MLPRCSTSNSSTSAFSIFFPLQSSSSASMDHFADQGGSCYYYYSSSPSPASVDCTLSLGTPSTRQTSGTAANASVTHYRSLPCGKPASGCWDIINDATNAAAGQCSKPPQQASAPTGNVIGGDPLLLARRCANCDTTSTPLWRNGPRGPKSLCNACGIRYKKEERRAAASTASPTVLSTTSSTESVNYAATTNYPAWSCYPAAPTAPATKNSRSPWRGPSDESNVDHAPNYFSWRLNVVPPSQFPVTDNRPSLFQYQ